MSDFCSDRRYSHYQGGRHGERIQPALLQFLIKNRQKLEGYRRMAMSHGNLDCMDAAECKRKQKAGGCPAFCIRFGILLAQCRRPGAVQVITAPFDFEAVGAEEVALALDQVGGALSLSVAVEIAQRCREADHREFADGGSCHHLAQARMGVLEDRDQGHAGGNKEAAVTTVRHGRQL